VPATRKRRLALVVAPNLFADALASVLAADDVDEVIDLTTLDVVGNGGTGLGFNDHYDTAVVSPGADIPDADVVIVLPPSGTGEVVVTRQGSTEQVNVQSVSALLDLLDVYAPAPAGRRRRRPK
jgi:hypothetical protein